MLVDEVMQQARVHYCRNCKSDYYAKTIAIPHVFKYLMAELASVGIKVNFHVSEMSQQ